MAQGCSQDTPYEMSTRCGDLQGASCDFSSLSQKDLDPRLDAITFRDPRSPQRRIPIVAFYYPGRQEPVDEICRSGFLGNFFDLGYEGLYLQPAGRDGKYFRNAEAAFQACKFWHLADTFQYLSGNEAFRRKSHLSSPDFSYTNYGSNWKAMKAVLNAKFKQGTAMGDALIKTRDAFLLEHNSTEGRESIWSNNHFGDGTNWLGVQLMLVRDELTYRREWTSFFSKFLDLEDGSAKMVKEEWLELIQDATAATVLEVEKKQKAVGKWAYSPASFVTSAFRPAPSSTAFAGSEQFPATNTVPTTAGVVGEQSLCGTKRKVDCSLSTWENCPVPQRDVTAFSASDCRPFFRRSLMANSMVVWSQADVATLDVDMMVVPNYGGLCRHVRSAGGAALERVYNKEYVCGAKPFLTQGHKLKAKYVLFVSTERSQENLAHCCLTALNEAVKNGLSSVALPCLVGFIHPTVYNLSPPAHVMLKTVREWIDQHEGELGRVILVTYAPMEKKVYGGLLPYYFPKHGDYECRELDQDHTFVKVVITWNEKAFNVSLSTSLDNWTETGMELTGDFFRLAWRVRRGSTFQYRFVVDGQFRIRDDQPRGTDFKGADVNEMDLSKPKTSIF